MFAFLIKGRVLQLPVNIMLEMFNKTVLPIMLHGCKVWGFDKNGNVRYSFPEFCKYLLGLKSWTPNCMVRYWNVMVLGISGSSKVSIAT